MMKAQGLGAGSGSRLRGSVGIFRGGIYPPPNVYFGAYARPPKAHGCSGVDSLVVRDGALLTCVRGIRIFLSVALKVEHARRRLPLRVDAFILEIDPVAILGVGGGLALGSRAWRVLRLGYV